MKIYTKGGEKMKRAVSVLVAMLMLFSCPEIKAQAYDTREEDIIVTEDIASAEKSSMLNIRNGNTAVCASIFDDCNSSIYSIKAVQTLEKHWGLGIFFSVDGASWEKTVYTDYINFNNSKSNLPSGTYRLKTVFTVKLIDGQTETTTLYSAERTI